MWRITYTFFLTVAVRKDYIHGALFFYSELSVGIIVWTRFRPGCISGCKAAGVLGHRAVRCFGNPTQRGWINHQHLFTVISGFNSRLGG